MNLVMIITSMRTALIYVDGYERSAVAAYYRSKNEQIYCVKLVRA